MYSLKTGALRIAIFSVVCSITKILNIWKAAIFISNQLH